MKHIVSFSTGLSSALTVERVLARYGKASTRIIFMDTTIEDEDNYRFMGDCKNRWGVPITVLREGRDPYQVAKDKQIIPNQKIAPCTFVLKIEMFRAYLKQITGPGSYFVACRTIKGAKTAESQHNVSTTLTPEQKAGYKKRMEEMSDE